MDLEDISPPRRALYGLRQALDRYDRALQAKVTDGIYCASVEAAMWASAADDWWGEHVSAYAEERWEAPDGLLKGLRWARHRGVHQVVGVHRMEGPTLPRSLPFPLGFSVTWLPRLAVSDTGRSQPPLEVAYDEHLAGRDVGETLRAVYRFFSGLPPDVLPSWSSTEGTN